MHNDVSFAEYWITCTTTVKRLVMLSRNPWLTSLVISFTLSSRRSQWCLNFADFVNEFRLNYISPKFTSSELMSQICCRFFKTAFSQDRVVRPIILEMRNQDEGQMYRVKKVNDRKRRDQDDQKAAWACWHPPRGRVPLILFHFYRRRRAT